MDKVREALEKLLIAVAGDGPGSEPNVYADYDELNKLIKECREALTSDPWQPIETAPKDGNMILAYTTSSNVDGESIMTTVEWRVDDMGGFWKIGFNRTHKVDIQSLENYTHWMPLPNPPVKEF